jgi:hypothetical protein
MVLWLPIHQRIITKMKIKPPNKKKSTKARYGFNEWDVEEQPKAAGRLGQMNKANRLMKRFFSGTARKVGNG